VDQLQTDFDTDGKISDVVTEQLQKLLIRAVANGATNAETAFVRELLRDDEMGESKYSVDVTSPSFNQTETELQPSPSATLSPNSPDSPRSQQQKNRLSVERQSPRNQKKRKSRRQPSRGLDGSNHSTVGSRGDALLKAMKKRKGNTQKN